MRAPFDIKHFPLLLKGRLYFPSKLWLQKQLSRHHKKGPWVTGRCRYHCWTPKEKYLLFIKIIPKRTLPNNSHRTSTSPWRHSGGDLVPAVWNELLHDSCFILYGCRSASRLSRAWRRYLHSHQWCSGQQKLIASGVCFQWKHVNSGSAAV